MEQLVGEALREALEDARGILAVAQVAQGLEHFLAALRFDRLPGSHGDMKPRAAPCGFDAHQTARAPGP